MKCLLLPLVLSLFTLSAFAQNRVGNGGDVILCLQEGKIKKIALLDFYENSKEEVTSALDYEHVLLERLELLKQKDAALGTQYQERWKKMKSEIDFKDNVELIDIKDSNHLFEPSDKSCQLKQIAIRRTSPAGNQALFLISKIYWKELSSVQQAGLILHEIVYEHFYKLGEKDSAKARVFNSSLFAKDFEKQSPEDFWKLLRSLKVPLYRK